MLLAKEEEQLNQDKPKFMETHGLLNRLVPEVCLVHTVSHEMRITSVTNLMLQN